MLPGQRRVPQVVRPEGNTPRRPGRGTHRAAPEGPREGTADKTPGPAGPRLAPTISERAQGVALSSIGPSPFVWAGKGFLGRAAGPPRGDGLNPTAPGLPQLTTVTVLDATEVWVSGAVAPSVTTSSKLNVSPTVNVFPAIVQVTDAPSDAPLPLFTAHWVAST
jgi:hypothetical protein